jgi:hypothetical protein
MPEDDGEFNSSGTPPETDPEHSSAPANAGLDADIVEGDRPCVNCGYNLRGLGKDGVCPECGTPISFSLSELPAFVRKPKADVPLERDTPCVCCGNVLRMQTTHGACSSCGAPVWYSLYGTWLRTSDPRWLGRLKSGVILWLIVIVGGFVFGCLAGSAAAAWAIAAGAREVEAQIEIYGPIAGVLFAFVIVLFYLAIADRLMTPHPASSDLPGADKGRKAVKMCFLIGFIGVLLSNAAQLNEWPFWVVLAGFSIGLGSVPGHMGLIHQVRKLASRIPDRKMERSALIVMWGYGISLGAAQLTNSVMGVSDGSGGFPTTGTAQPPVSMMSVACVAGAASLVFTIWLIVLLSRFLSTLTRSIQQVQADWPDAKAVRSSS